ncbi:hypothetical protein EW146_g2573 [Bondarzewia mesenterica]|uniref:DUF6533 domain-containing protein n=1 Tax=Bondarzewia mesenterica TaxID=1095465 RepID=A0A4S4M074_9AGAM|nr:hypothetical protein EW146_g2573 [Bondarzewia mesenterica]
MYAVVLWDWVISLPREWQFIWRTCWTPVKVAYLFCRYWVIAVVPYLLYCFVIDHPFDECRKIYKIPVALAMWNQVGAESVLLIRTYAFFNRNKFVLTFLLCALAGMVAYQLYVDTSQMLVLPFVKPPFDQGPCFPMSKPHSAHLLGFFIAPLGYDTIVTLMTVWKAFYIRRHNGGPSSRLIQTFLREGVFYYLLISIANLINGIFYLQPRQVISAINIPLSVMLSPVLACRLILDLRERGSETVAHSEGTVPVFGPRIFGIRFGGPRSDSNGASRPTPSGIIRSHIRTKTSAINSGVVLSTIGSVTGAEMLSPDSAVELDSIGRKGLREDRTRVVLGHDHEYDVPEYRAVEMMNLGMGLGGAVHGIKVDVEKQTSTI